MTSPVSRSADPVAIRPPDADPVAIRACLPSVVAAVFDAEWESTLEQAKRSKDLAGVRELVAHWRHFAYQELLAPGSYSRVLATAARTQATRQAPPRSLSAEELRAQIEARLAQTGSDDASRR